MQFLFGADPEVFVRDRETKKFVSAHGMIKGTKYEPTKVKNGAIQVDGMALEFNVKPSRLMGDTFFFRTQSILSLLSTLIPSKYEVVVAPVARFDQEYIETQPDVAKRLGCEPDYNAWTGKMNQPPRASAPFRTAAGHIHIGWWTRPIRDQERAYIMAAEAAKQMDCTVGLASVILDRSPDSRMRRELYGKAGAFRPKPYGMEYRTPSNFWIQGPHFPVIARLTMEATRLLNQGTLISSTLSAANQREVQRAINESDTDTAFNLLDWIGRKHGLLSLSDMKWFKEQLNED